MMLRVQVLMVSFLIMLTASCVPPTLAPEYRNLELIIHQPVEVYDGHARAFIQAQKNISGSQIDRFKPFCDVEIKQVATDTIIIPPSSYEVNYIYSDYGDSGFINVRGIRRYRQFLDDDLGPYDLRTIVEVNPANEQGVLKIRCTRWSSDGYDYHLNLSQMNEIMQGLVSIDQAKLL